jgi:large repetitive protein
MKSLMQLIRLTILLMVLSLPTLAAAADGATLFTTYCVKCHTQAKMAGRTAAQIQTAMTAVSQHSSFASALVTADYTALATYLATATTTLSISTTSLATGTVGTAYSQTLAATGGTSPYTWAVSSGTLPTGLTLSSAGVISGTPTAAVTSSVTFKATDSATTKATATKALSITIAAAGTTTSGATLFTTYCASCHTQTKLSGRTAAQIQTAMTAVSQHSSFRASLTTADYTALATYLASSTSTTLAVSTTSLASGTVATAYSQTLAATGGTSPYTWAVSSGTLPTGLTLSSAGVISGTPTAATTTMVTFQVTDSATTKATATATLTITISATGTSTDGATLFSSNCISCHTAAGLSGRTVAQLQTALSLAIHSSISLVTTQIQAISTYLGRLVSTLTIPATTLPVAVMNSPYGQTLSATGGTAPYSWSYSGTLPPGIGLYTTGLLTGTPTALGTYSFTVRVADASSASATRILTVTVARTAPLTITGATLTAGAVGTPYTNKLLAYGGQTPYTWKATGILPPGLTVTSAGAISGTPTSRGKYLFTATVIDGKAATVTSPISLTITSAGVTFPTLKPARYDSCANCHTSTPYTTPPAGQWTP